MVHPLWLVMGRGVRVDERWPGGIATRHGEHGASQGRWSLIDEEMDLKRAFIVSTIDRLMRHSVFHSGPSKSEQEKRQKHYEEWTDSLTDGKSVTNWGSFGSILYVLTFKVVSCDRMTSHPIVVLGHVSDEIG
jgi:hypothetical protein